MAPAAAAQPAETPQFGTWSESIFGCFDSRGHVPGKDSARGSSTRGGSLPFLNWFKNDCFCTAVGTKDKSHCKTCT
jgi:hypothetical protein